MGEKPWKKKKKNKKTPSVLELVHFRKLYFGTNTFARSRRNIRHKEKLERE